MIFDPEIYCTAAETAELDGTAPLALAGDGLWVGVLYPGACLLGGVERPIPPIRQRCSKIKGQK